MGKENTSKHAFHTIEKFRVNTWHYVGMKATTNVLCCIWQGKPPIKSNIYCSLWNGDQTPHSTCCLVNSIQYYCMYYDMLYHLNLGALDLVLVPFHLILYACGQPNQHPSRTLFKSSSSLSIYINHNMSLYFIQSYKIGL